MSKELSDNKDFNPELLNNTNTSKEEGEELEENDDELFEHHSFTADKGQTLLRVDKFIMDRLEHSSRTKIQDAAAANNIMVNGNPVKSNYKVKPKDVVTIMLPYPPREIELRPENIPLEILYEDEDILIINKPAGLVVHPGHGNYTGTLVNGLIYHFQNLPNSCELAFRPGLVHRLDKNTSGVMVIAKSELAMGHLAKQFFDRTIDRRYNTLVWGIPKEESGIIETNLARSLKDRKVMAPYEFHGEIGKHAITNYKVLETYQYVSLVECKLETGRTHQIRVHMQHLGNPVFNDSEYGGNKILKGLPTANYKRFIHNCFELIPGQALHAKTLELTHPRTGERMKFEKDRPIGFENIIEKFTKILTSI